jgi:1-aminocyclopropane-1-carboxylate deaminase
VTFAFQPLTCLQVVLIPRNAVPSRLSQETYTQLGNVQFNNLLSARTFSIGGSKDEAIAVLTKEGKTPYWIPSGASTHPLGGLGFARWAFEVLEQEKELGLRFDTIVTACMSGSTLGGLVAGFKLAEKTHGLNGSKKRLIGISAGTNEALKTEVLDIARTAAETIGLSRQDIQEQDFEINMDFSGGAYGNLDDSTKKHVKMLAELEAVVLDPVYTGKAMTGLCELARARNVEGNVLFLHTGGVLSVSAYPDLK